MPLATLAVCHKRVNAVRLARGDLVAYACRDGTVGVVRQDGAQLVPVDSFATAGAALAVQVDALGRYVVSFDEGRTVFAYDLATRLLSRYVGHSASLTFVAPGTAEFPYVVSADARGTFRVWAPPDRSARILFQTDSGLSAVKFSPDGRWLAATGVNGVARRIELASGEAIALVGHTDLVKLPTFSPDGTSLVTPSNDGTVRVWKADGTVLGVFTGHRGAVNGVEWVGANRIASIGDDGRLLLWPADATSQVELFAAAAPLTFLRALANTGHLVVGDARGAVWDIAGDGRARAVRGARGAVTMLRPSHDGRRVALGGDDGSVTVYDTASWTVIASASAARSIWQLQFDPMDRAIVFAATDGHVRVLSLDGSSALGWDDVPLLAHDVAFSPDGEVLALLVDGGGTWLYEIRERSWVYVRDHQEQVSRGEFSPDGKWFASCDGRGAVTVRDVATTFASRRRAGQELGR